MLRVAREEDLSAGIEIVSGQIICQQEMTCLREIIQNQQRGSPLLGIGIRVLTPQDDIRVARYLLRVAICFCQILQRVILDGKGEKALGSEF